MRSEPHPLGGTIYSAIGEGKVRVQKPGSESYGIFDWRGEWLEGDVKEADPHMLLFIAGPDLPETHDVLWMQAGAGPYADPSAPPDYAPGSHMSQLPRLVTGYAPDKGQMTSKGARSQVWLETEFFLQNDRRPELIPDAFKVESPMTGGPKQIRTDRFWKKEYHDLEVEHLWRKTWQMVCREDDIPEVGDYHVYNIAELSYLIVHTAQGIKAYQNVCLHRGRQLKECSGKGARDIMCRYHGFTWHLDGSIKSITTEWDFPGVRASVARLPEAKVALWAGFIFINPDPRAIAFADFLGPVAADYYRKIKLENRYKQAHVQKVMGCNWKVAHEAFMEAFHVIATHPHQMYITGDLANLRYEVFGNWGRAGLMSPGGGPQRGMTLGSKEKLLAGHRELADRQREFLRPMIGDEVDQFSDVELTDVGSFNNLFPNVMPWGGFTRICFRFLPNGSNPEECIMEAMLLAPWPEGKPKPPPAKLRRLGIADAWTAAPELLSLSKILDQDEANLVPIQRGVRAKNPPFIWYSAYQEGKIRKWHELYDEALGIHDEGPSPSPEYAAPPSSAR